MKGDAEDRRLVREWLAAASRADVRDAIARVHDAIAGEVVALAPVCEQSGRCCRFEEYGHRLYVTGLETAATLLGAGLVDADGNILIITDAPADAATAVGGLCPLATGRACGVHADRPAGCRVFYCDPIWAPATGRVSERAAGEIRAMHERFGVPYRYGEWRGLLAMFGVAGPIFAESDGVSRGYLRVRVDRADPPRRRPGGARE